ncbi:MAG TPA: CSLREA domain-containing protein, partial [Isosphaeraceae bacterium]
MAVFTVNSTADILSPPPGVVTLRSAIQAANNSPGSDTINMPLAGTYKLTTVGTATDNSAGELAIADAGDLTIQNTSGGAVTINGGGLNRVFEVNPANSATLMTATFFGLTITGGLASGTSPNGGGIEARGGGA